MATPQQIGRYQVRDRIGSGGFATVWRAYDPELDNDVAVKILAENWIERTDIRGRFTEEARYLRRADSDRIVRVHDIGTLDDGRPYFVMSYADRGTLSERIAAGPLSVEQVLEYTTSSARGVAILHDLGVLHRDIKPSNILFRSTASGEQLMIADLGLAKAIAHASGFTVAAGTPGYMAPEQAQMGGGLDRRVDVYALGALVYQMLTGRKPSPASSGQPTPPPSQLRSGLRPDVDALVMRALERDRERRWADAASFADAASQSLQTLLDVTAPPSTPVPPPAVPQQAPGSAPESAPPTVTPTQQAPTPQPAQQTPTPQQSPVGTPVRQQAAAPYPVPAPLGEHPSFPGGKFGQGGAKPPLTPEQRRRRSRRWTVAGASCLALLLAGVGVLVWSQLRPVTIRTQDSAVVAQVPQDWVPTTPSSNTPEDMEDFGAPGRSGTRLTTQSDFQTLDSEPGITVVASKSFNDASAAVFTEKAPPTDMWDTSSCAEPTTAKVTPRGFADGQLRTWSGCSSSYRLGQALLHGEGYGVQVFMVETGDQDQFEDALDTIEVDQSKLP